MPVERIADVLDAVAVGASGLAFVVVWGPFMLRQHAADMGEHLAFLQHGDGGWLGRLVLLPVRSLAVLGPGYGKPEMLAGLALWLAIGAVALWRRDRGALLWLMLLVAAVGPVLANDAVSGGQGLAFARYRYPAGAPILALLAGAAATVGGTRATWRWHLVPAAACLVALACLSQTYTTTKPPWRTLAREVDRLAKPGAVLVVAAEGLDYWQAESTYVLLDLEGRALPRPTLFATRPVVLPEDVRRGILITPRHEKPATKLLPGWHVIEASAVMPLASVAVLEADTRTVLDTSPPSEMSHGSRQQQGRGS